MKAICLNKFITLSLPDGLAWKADQLTNILHIQQADGDEICALSVLTVPADMPSSLSSRAGWCHDSIVDHLQNAVGPPFQSSIEEVNGGTWIGYQSVTALGKDTFLGTRCVIGKSEPAAVRFTFYMVRGKIDGRVLELIESLSIAI